MKHALNLLLIATAFSFGPFFFEEFEQPKAWAMISFACFAAFFVDWRIILKDKIALYLSLFAISAGLSATFSIDKHVSIFGNPKCPAGVLVFASYLIVYLVASHVLRIKRNAETTISVMIGCSAIVTLYAIAQAVGFDFIQWRGTLERFGYVRPMSTLGHPNFMAAYVGMILPFSLWRTDFAKSYLEKNLYRTVSVLSVTAVFLSLSRGMIVAMFCGALSYFLIERSFVKKIGTFFKLSLTILIAITALNPSFRQSATDRLPAMFSPGYGRIQYPTAALKIWGKNPWFGIGTDAFEFGFQHERTEHYWVVEHAGSPHKAHCDILNVLATQGIVGFIIAILLTVAVFYRTKRSSIYRAPAVASIVSFYVAGLTSFTIVATGVVFIVCLSLLKGKEREMHH